MNDRIDELVSAFLSRDGSGEGSTLGEFLRTVPEELRRECKEGVEAAVSARARLDDLLSATGSRDDEPAAPPVVPGFRIDRELGRGALATVWLAFDETLQRAVALKVLRHARGAEVRRRILDEARRSASLDHPSIVRIHSIVETEDLAAIVMELVEGLPLGAALGGLDFRQKARLFLSLARALEAAHEKGVLHRDLKPENVLVTPSFVPRVVDFGLALRLGEGETAPRFFQGTPLYASPEQARCEELTTASDIFSFGSLLFLALTGSPPFSGETADEVISKIATEEPPFPRHARSAVPEDLQAICLACLSRDPRRRPRARDLAEDLSRFLSREPVQLRPALYDDVLKRHVAESETRLRDWEAQGMVSSRERDKLLHAYRRILDEEDHWVFDARRLTATQTLLNVASWIVVVSGFFLLWLVRDEVSPTVRWSVPLSSFVLLLLFGLFTYLRRERLSAVPLLTAAVLTSVPATLSVLGELGLAAGRPGEVTQLLGPPFTNQQILIATGFGLLLSLLCLRMLRLTGFAWTSGVLVVVTYGAALLLGNLLDQDPEFQALRFLPLVLCLFPALLLESAGRPRWALPFHLVALLSLIGCLDVMALFGPTLEMLRLVIGEPEAWLDDRRNTNLSLAVTGLLFLTLAFVLEKSRSLDLRRGARILEIAAPLHILGPLYSSALETEGPPYLLRDAGLYAGGVLLFLLLAPLGHRHRFLVAGLLGVAAALHLVLTKDLVPRAPFVVGLCAVGLLLALGTASWRLLRLRRKAPRPPQSPSREGR